MGDVVLLILRASLHLAEESVRNDATTLRDWVISRRITICFAATVMAERLLRLEWPSKTALRFLLTGADTLKAYPSTLLPFVLVNNYGPTECTVVILRVSCQQELPPTTWRIRGRR